MAIQLDKDNLEKALSRVGNEKSAEQENKLESQQMPEMPKETGKVSSSPNRDEEKGFHQGSLNTLAAERMELVKMIGNVEAIMQAHLKRLEELGVKIDKAK